MFLSRNPPNKQKQPPKNKPKTPTISLVQLSHLEKQSETDLSPHSQTTSLKGTVPWAPLQ